MIEEKSITMIQHTTKAEKNKMAHILIKIIIDIIKKDFINIEN